MSQSPLQPWDQREGESDAAYARFLHYLNLGSTRSLNAAYVAYSEVSKGGERCQRAPGSWQAESVEKDWVKKANSWDVQQLKEKGEQAVKLYFDCLHKITSKTLSELEQETVVPKTWGELLMTFDKLSQWMGAIDAIEWLNLGNVEEQDPKTVTSDHFVDAGERS